MRATGLAGVGLNCTLRFYTSTWRRVFHLAWPVIAGGSVRATMRTVDLIVVGLFVGPAAVAAVGLGDVFARIVLQVALGLGAGTTALVAQSYGAGDHHAANRVTTQTGTLAVLVGVPITVVGFVVADDFLRLLGASGELLALGTVYLQVIVLSATFRIFGRMEDRALQGAEDTRTPVVINTAGTVVNILLTVVLVVGPGPIPSYGILGAAVGTAVGNVLAGGAYLLVLPTGRFRVRFTVDGVWDPGLAREILDIGVPQVVDRSVTAVGDVPLNAIILFFGTEANAAFHIGRRVQQYARMPNWGVSTAASTLVGTHLGRDEPDESERYARGALALGLTISVVLAVVVVAFARPLARVFVSEPVTLALSVEWIRTLGVATVVYSVFLSLRGSLQGAGDTRWPLYGSVLGIFGFAIGFSYVVGVVLGVGLLGVYAGFVLDYAARSFVAYYRFDSGAWKHRGTPAESSVPAQ